MGTLATILKENWDWRHQIFRLSVFDMKKKSRGTALGWVWFFIEPIIYVTCFWFAIEIGLKAMRVAPGDAPFILWLAAGLVPWFFMRTMIREGSNAFNKHTYLVNRVKFPLSAVCTIHTLGEFLINLLQMIVVFAVYAICWQPPTVYLLQLPILWVLMFAFWNMFSIMLSPLSAISKDFGNLVKSLGTPLFWLSGIIFNLDALDVPAIETVMDYNPICFFAYSFRDAFYNQTWFWEDTNRLIGFAVVFALTFAVMLLVYSKTNQEVADVI